MSNTVMAKCFEGLNMTLLQIIGLGPQFTITCGHCDMTFKKRIPMVNNPGIACPGCATINIIPVVLEAAK